MAGGAELGCGDAVSPVPCAIGRAGCAGIAWAHARCPGPLPAMKVRVISARPRQMEKKNFFSVMTDSYRVTNGIPQRLMFFAPSERNTGMA